MIKIKDSLKEYLKYLDSPAITKGQINGLKTGLVSLDRFLLGLQPSMLIVIGGRPGMGTTSLGLKFAVEAAKQTAHSVAIFTYENIYSDVTKRILSAEANVCLRRIEAKELDEKELRSISKAVKTLSALQLSIEDCLSIDIDRIRMKCIELKAETGLAMILIDSIETMPLSKNKPEETVSFLKDLAIELNIPIVILASLNSPKRNPSRRPWLSDLKNVAILENSVDVVCLLYREDYYHVETPNKGLAEIIIPLNRRGGHGYMTVKWNNSCLKFSDPY